MNQYENPKWWTQDNDSAWSRTKEAFKRDWDQTKHDLGAKEPDTNQSIKNTVKQATGNEAIPPRHQPTFDEVEAAYRFGHGAHFHYGGKYPQWNAEIEKRLQDDWKTSNPFRRDNWEEDRDAIRHAWNYKG